VVAQAFNSDVGVDNDPISYRGGYVWYEVLGITPPRDRTLGEVKDQVAARWREDETATRLRAKATELVQKLNQGGKLADEATPLGVQVETATSFKRDATLPGVPTGVVTAAFRTAKDSVGQTEAAGGSQWVVFRVTEVAAPAVDLASEDVKKLKDTLQRALNEEQSAQYVARLEKDIGTTINEAALAQVVGGNNQ
jgi:peptidyl-prolyl cis-trans isomerase D